MPFKLRIAWPCKLSNSRIIPCLKKESLHYIWHVWHACRHEFFVSCQGLTRVNRFVSPIDTGQTFRVTLWHVSFFSIIYSVKNTYRGNKLSSKTSAILLRFSRIMKFLSSKTNNVLCIITSSALYSNPIKIKENLGKFGLYVRITFTIAEKAQLVFFFWTYKTIVTLLNKAAILKLYCLVWIGSSWFNLGFWYNIKFSFFNYRNYRKVLFLWPPMGMNASRSSKFIWRYSSFLKPWSIIRKFMLYIDILL